MNIFRYRQVTIRKLDLAPQWLLDEAAIKELDFDWNGVYEKGPSSTISLDATVISSHLVFKIKKDKTKELICKARLVLHENCDADCFFARRNHASADLCIVRIILSLAQILHFFTATVDVKGAYKQSRPITETYMWGLHPY